MKVLVTLLLSLAYSNNLLNIYASSYENREVCMNSSRVKVLTLDFSEATYSFTSKRDNIAELADGFAFSDKWSFKINLSKSKGKINAAQKQYIKSPEKDLSIFPLSITYKRINSKVLELVIYDSVEDMDGIFSCTLQLELSSNSSGTAQGTFWYIGNEGKVSNIKFTLAESSR